MQIQNIEIGKSYQKDAQKIKVTLQGHPQQTVQL